MDALYNAITGATRETLKDRLWQEVVLRLARVSSGCTLPGEMLRLDSKSVQVPPERPSGTPTSRIEYHIGLQPAFSQPLPVLAQYKLAHGLHLRNLVGMATGRPQSRTNH